MSNLDPRRIYTPQQILEWMDKDGKWEGTEARALVLSSIQKTLDGCPDKELARLNRRIAAAVGLAPEGFK